MLVVILLVPVVFSSGPLRLYLVMPLPCGQAKAFWRLVLASFPRVPPLSHDPGEILVHDENSPVLCFLFPIVPVSALAWFLAAPSAPVFDHAWDARCLFRRR